MTRPFVYDPGAPDFHDDPFATYRILRDEHPVYRNDARGTWALSRYQDVRAAAANDHVFSSEGASTGAGLLPMLVSMDPPRHDQLRNLLSKAFTPRRVADLEPSIRKIACELIDGFASEGRADLVSQLASPLPSRVIGELIGIPADRREAFAGWTEALVSADPKKQDLGDLFPSIYGEFEKLLAERRLAPRNDLMSALIAAEIDGEGLSQEELLGFCSLLVIAGNDTTMNLIANGAVLLAKHPEQREAIVQDAGLIPCAIEEMLRYESPVQALPRIATVDVEIHGVTIPMGDEVSLVWGAANHDEREFEDPERFDIFRRENPHLALGHGKHFCMGASFARLEARIVFEELMQRLPEYELEEDPGWYVSPWARAHERVPIRFGAS